MRTKEQESYIKAYQATYEFYKEHGVVPKCQRMDNETSAV